MKKLADELTKPYGELSRRHLKMRADASRAAEAGRAEMNQWPRIRSVNKREIVPLFRRWSKDLKKTDSAGEIQAATPPQKAASGSAGSRLVPAQGLLHPHAQFPDANRHLDRQDCEAGRGAVVGLRRHPIGHLGGQPFSSRTIEDAEAKFHKGWRRNILPNSTQVCSFTSLKL